MSVTVRNGGRTLDRKSSAHHDGWYFVLPARVTGPAAIAVQASGSTKRYCRKIDVAVLAVVSAALQLPYDGALPGRPVATVDATTFDDAEKAVPAARRDAGQIEALGGLGHCPRQPS
jgi:hypothetical protein